MVVLPEIFESKQLFGNQQVAEFHAYYKQSNPEDHLGPPWCRWKGYVALKCPLDLWIYQELIHEYGIDAVVECGTAGGGSALFLAEQCPGSVVSVDIDPNCAHPVYPNLRFVVGDTLNPFTMYEAFDTIEPYKQVMLILDDGHSKEHVQKELPIWTTRLKPGDVLVVEDTDIGGPYWGLQRFMYSQSERDWERLTWCEKFGLTQNPWGYWRRK